MRAPGGLRHAVIGEANDELLTLAMYQRAMTGDLGALKAYLLILDQRAALLGLDANSKRAK
jgi:hypothetical protein